MFSKYIKITYLKRLMYIWVKLNSMATDSVIFNPSTCCYLSSENHVQDFKPNACFWSCQIKLIYVFNNLIKKFCLRIVKHTEWNNFNLHPHLINIWFHNPWVILPLTRHYFSNKTNNSYKLIMYSRINW